MEHLDMRASNKALCSGDDLQRALKLTPWLKSLSGHSLRPYADLSDVQRPMRWYAILRHPVSRLLSHYQQQIGKKDAAFKDYNLVDWMEKYQRHNWQVKMIAGEVNVDRAFETLNKFSAVGLNERYEESLFLFRNQMGLDIDFARNQNPGPLPPEDPEVKRSIEAQALEATDFINSKLAPEIELYNRVKDEIYARQVKDYGGNEKLKNDLEDYLAGPQKVTSKANVLLNRIQTKLHPCA